MYLKPTRTFYVGSEERTARGPFLLLLQPTRATIAETCAPENTYAVVRRVALSQFGHYMMGRVNLGGKWCTVSGAYGSDGLPMSVETLPADAKPLPRELYDVWNKGGGHNSAGSEASAMREWARATFKRKTS